MHLALVFARDYRTVEICIDKSWTIKPVGTGNFMGPHKPFPLIPYWEIFWVAFLSAMLRKGLYMVLWRFTLTHQVMKWWNEDGAMEKKKKTTRKLFRASWIYIQNIIRKLMIVWLNMYVIVISKACFCVNWGLLMLKYLYKTRECGNYDKTIKLWITIYSRKLTGVV